jgi:hypothetical protein
MSHHCDEHYSVYNERNVVARKPHTCSACHETIAPGHAYTRVFIVWDGQIDVVLRCARCQAIHEHLREVCEDKSGGEMWPAEELNCGQEYREHWGVDPPPEIAALAFLLPGEPLPEPPGGAAER